MELIRNEIEPLLRKNTARALDIGCAQGDTGCWLKEQKFASFVAGIEIDETLATTAKKKLDQVLTCDVESSELPFAPASFDLVLCLDVLEHLRDPWSALKKLREQLSPEGELVTSIPNVRNFRVILPLLLKGSWEYQDSGLLDRTHLRFFTKKSALRLVEEAGFEIQEVRTTGARFGGFSFFANILTLGLMKDIFVLQYLIRAKPKKA